MTAIDPKIERLVDEAERDCAESFARLDIIERHNTRRVLTAFQKHRVSARHFAPTTGYGYDDIGRDTLSAIFAELLGSVPATRCWPPAASPMTRWKRSSACPARRGAALWPITA